MTLMRMSSGTARGSNAEVSEVEGDPRWWWGGGGDVVLGDGDGEHGVTSGGGGSGLGQVALVGVVSEGDGSDDVVSGCDDPKAASWDGNTEVASQEGVNEVGGDNEV